MPEPRAMVRNASDPKQVRSAGESLKFAAEAKANRLRAIMSTYDGRWWMWEHLDDLGPFRSVFVTSSEIYYRAGKQDAGHQLLDQITETCPEMFVLMQSENIERMKQKTEPKPRTADPIEEDDDGN